MRLITWAGVALLAFPLILTAGDDAKVKKELKALEGTWNIWPMTETSVRQIFKYHGPGIAIFNCRADGSATVELLPEGSTRATLTLDLTKKPKRMVITQVSGSQKGKKQYAIYKLEGDTLTLFATPPGAPEKDRPADFNDRNARANLLVYKRVKDGKEVLDRLQGEWEVIRMEDGGTVIPVEKLPDKLFILKGDELIPSKNPKDPGKLTLDPEKKPGWLDLTDRAKKTMPGIYRLEGDRWEICLADVAGVRPTEFKTTTKGKAKTYLMVLQRKK